MHVTKNNLIYDWLTIGKMVYIEILCLLTFHLAPEYFPYIFQIYHLKATNITARTNYGKSKTTRKLLG